MNKIERLTAEILLLQERKRGSEEIAELLQISKRTVIRDIRALCMMGVPVISRDGAGGGYELAGDFKISPLQLSWREALLLAIAIDGLGKMSQSPFMKERASLLAKIHALLPEKHRERVEEMRSKVEIEVPERERKSALLDELLEHVEEGQWIEIEYRSADETKTFKVLPKRVFAGGGFWYLEARSRGKNLVFRADRILSISETEGPEKPLDEPPAYDDPSHPTVRVLLTSRGIAALERDQHMGHIVRGAVAPFDLEFRCPPGELDWFAKFFGGMGADAIVSSPPELIEKIMARVDELVKIYKCSETVTSKLSPKG